MKAWKPGLAAAHSSELHSRESPGPSDNIGPTSIGGSALRMRDVVQLISLKLDHPVIGRTGLTRTYNFKVDWSTDSNPHERGSAGCGYLLRAI
jgi:uncharacterized protein (TIGR03435 family)